MLKNQPRTVIQSMVRTPNNPAVIPGSTGATDLRDGVQVTTGTNLQSQGDIAHLITHIAKSDNHLWQALTALQAQTNGIVNNTGRWTSWDPQFRDVSGQVPTYSDVAAYYMTYGPLLFIELRANITTISNRTEISMPVNVGSIVVKTCAAYMMIDTTVPTFVGVIGVEIVDTTALITVAPPVVGVDAIFMMGGAIAIL